LAFLGGEARPIDRGDARLLPKRELVKLHRPGVTQPRCICNWFAITEVGG
jgi:hypothetical protein